MTSDPDPRGRLTRTLVHLILLAAVVTAPVFVFGEGFEARYIGRVAATNGPCVLLCLGLLWLLNQGRHELAGRLLVLGLMVLVGGLAWAGGERVHVNVINFVLIAVLASAVTTRRLLALVAGISVVEMVAIAWTRPFVEAGHELGEARFEAIAQFLPTYMVVVTVLWLRTER